MNVFKKHDKVNADLETNKLYFLSIAAQPCDTNPCRNQGVCMNNGNSYTCQCTAQYTGTNCETSKFHYLLYKSLDKTFNQKKLNFQGPVFVVWPLVAIKITEDNGCYLRV